MDKFLKELKNTPRDVVLLTAFVVVSAGAAALVSPLVSGPEGVTAFSPVLDHGATWFSDGSIWLWSQLFPVDAAQTPAHIAVMLSLVLLLVLAGAWVKYSPLSAGAINRGRGAPLFLYATIVFVLAAMGALYVGWGAEAGTFVNQFLSLIGFLILVLAFGFAIFFAISRVRSIAALALIVIVVSLIELGWRLIG